MGRKAGTKPPQPLAGASAGQDPDRGGGEAKGAHSRARYDAVLTCPIWAQFYKYHRTIVYTDFNDHKKREAYETFRQAAENILGVRVGTGSVVGSIREKWHRLSEEERMSVLTSAILIWGSLPKPFD